MDIRKAIDTTPMGGFQWYIIGLATFLNALDGYDVLAMAFTANSVTEEFGLSGSQLGLLLSSGLIGMALGSLILGPFADRMGRRRILIVALLINLTGLAMSATAGSPVELGIWRVITGLGIGGILATVTVITSEYSNNKNRGMAVSIYTAGYGLGATLGGALATQLIPAFGWRSVFAAGAVATLLALLLVIVSIPESVDYLRVKRPVGAEAKMEKIAHRLGKEGITEIGPANVASEATQVKLSSLLVGSFKATTLKLWAAFFIIMFGFYFANTWTPQLLVESGMSENQGIIGGLALTLGGTFGSLLYGAITIRFNSRHTLMVFSVLSALTLVVFITTTSIPALAFLSGVLVGMLINGCVAGLYTVTPAAYPSALRTTGVGWGIGVGRFGAIFAPITVGALLDAGWTPVYLYSGVAIVVVLAAVALIGIRPYLGAGDSVSGSRREARVAENDEAAAIS
ncbi:MFS transporter [Corynebacterium halotolerans]|uniref:MFS transporter n=1 Tax=Corynebacterium halotolerans TaxID=225326 RepID=UPI003CF6D3B7